MLLTPAIELRQVTTEQNKVDLLGVATHQKKPAVSRKTKVGNVGCTSPTSSTRWIISGSGETCDQSYLIVIQITNRYRPTGGQGLLDIWGLWAAAPNTALRPALIQRRRQRRFGLPDQPLHDSRCRGFHRRSLDRQSRCFVFFAYRWRNLIVSCKLFCRSHLGRPRTQFFLYRF